MNSAATLAWVDPRPPQGDKQLAARPTGATRRKLVFFDNSKLSPPYDRWMPVAPPILARMEALGGVQREYSDLLLEPVARHAERIAAWKAQGVDGVFFGLCDAGVTQPTLLLAAAAEGAGIPTVVLCTDQVISLAAVCASFMLPGLPLVLLRADRLAGGGGLTDAAATAAEAVVAALTRSPAQLLDDAQRSFPFTAGLARGQGDPARHESFDAFAQAARLGDGLPVVTPTRAAVDRMVAAGGRAADEVLIASLAPSGAPLSVQQAACCAVLAGCQARHFPFVLAALAAMAQPAYELHLATITTHPGGHLLLFSGPAAHEAGIAAGRGCMGPGNAANATIGRAVALVLQNVARAIAGLSVLSPFGSPAQYSFCFADAERGSLPPLHAELAGPGSDTTVWVFKCESPHNVLDHLSETPESLLGTIAGVAATIGGNNAYVPSDLLVVLNPEHARLLARAGWGRAQVQAFLWEHARNPRTRLAGRGAKAEWPPEWNGWDRLPVVTGPERIIVVEAGGAAPQSMVAIPWGYNRPCWAKVPIPA